MAFSLNRKGVQIVLLCGLLAGCSQSPGYVPPAFHPQQVACTDNSSPQMREQLDSLAKNPDGDLYLVRHIDHILPTTRELADAGNGHGMFAYGDMEYEYQYLLHQDAVEKGEGFPDSTRANLIDALTYVSLAAMTDSSDKHSAEQLRKEIERRIPAEWANEAKANVKGSGKIFAVRKWQCTPGFLTPPIPPPIRIPRLGRTLCRTPRSDGGFQD